MNMANTKVFTIKRAVNGVVYEFELTNAELSAALDCYDYNTVADIVKRCINTDANTKAVKRYNRMSQARQTRILNATIEKLAGRIDRTWDDVDEDFTCAFASAVDDEIDGLLGE